MIILDIEQGEDEWLAARCGIPTTSMFSNIITSKGGASTSSAPYMDQLLADWVAGKPVDNWKGNKYSEEGKRREPEAEALYQFITDNTIQSVGFIYKDEKKLTGSSTDGLINDDGVYEQKNPKASIMIHYILADRLPSIYKPQVQGELWITEREWCDFMIYHPNIGHKIWRIERDEKYITLMSGLISRFIGKMLEKRKKLESYKNV